MARPKKTDQEIQQMRERILEATSALVEEQGMANLSIRKIARRLGVSHMVLYGYFENREALVAALRDQQFARIRAHRDAALERARQGDAYSELRRALRSFLELGHFRPRLYRLVWLHPLNDERQAQLDWGVNHLTALLDLCIQQGSCAPRDARLAAVTALCMVNGPMLLHHTGRLVDPDLLQEVEQQALEAALAYLTGAAVDKEQ